MSEFSEQDLKYASEFRDGVHREALEIVRKTRPHITEVVDRHPVEDYFQEHWDYPGRWYTVVAIPCGYGSRKALVDAIVRDTLTADGPVERREPGRRRLSNQLEAKPAGFREMFTVDVNQSSRSDRTVGSDAEGRHILEHYEEYNIGSATGSAAAYYVLTDTEYRRYARLALVNGHLKEADYDRLTAALKKAPKQEPDPLFALLAEYPDCAVDYRIVKRDGRYLGYESHRRALKTARRTPFAAGVNGKPLRGDPVFAAGKRITVGELFSSDYRDGEPNYRKAFLYPPQGNRYTGRDFVRVNAALFPEGTEGLEVYAWNTDRWDCSGGGHERRDALCLTVYDKTLDRFVVITAPAAGGRCACSGNQ